MEARELVIKDGFLFVYFISGLFSLTAGPLVCSLLFACVYTVNMPIPQQMGRKTPRRAYLQWRSLISIVLASMDTAWTPSIHHSRYLMFAKISGFACVVLFLELRVKSKALRLLKHSLAWSPCFGVRLEGWAPSSVSSVFI